jgi:hypothetical protein
VCVCVFMCVCLCVCVRVCRGVCACVGCVWGGELDALRHKGRDSAGLHGSCRVGAVLS